MARSCVDEWSEVKVKFLHASPQNRISATTALHAFYIIRCDFVSWIRNRTGQSADSGVLLRLYVDRWAIFLFHMSSQSRSGSASRKKRSNRPDRDGGTGNRAVTRMLKIPLLNFYACLVLDTEKQVAEDSKSQKTVGEQRIP
jgi:hypothetical protein